jgi:hypothetical protein
MPQFGLILTPTQERICLFALQHMVYIVNLNSAREQVKVLSTQETLLLLF